MRIKSNSSSAGEQARSAETRRSAKPESTKGRFRSFTSALGGAAVALGAMTLCGGGTAYAGSIDQPGESVGIALGAPLPEGVYLANTLSEGNWRNIDTNGLSALGVEIDFFAWSTPWTIFGGRVEVLFATPVINAGLPAQGLLDGASFAGRDYLAMYQPTALVGEAWDLGNGWGFSSFIGLWAPIDNELRIFGNDVWSERNIASLSYTGNNWNLTATAIYDITGNTLSPTVFATPGNPQGLGKVLPDYVNLNLNAIKTLGKWEVGPVAFGSWDTTNSNSTTGFAGAHFQRQGQFAVGGLVGYQFPGVTLEAFATTDVWTQGYYNFSTSPAPGTEPLSKAYETRVWLRAVIPLWNPPKEEASLK